MTNVDINFLPRLNRVLLTIGDVNPGKAFVRPEYGRPGPGWACIAFRHVSELEWLMDNYEEGDVVIGTGTVNKEKTLTPAYQGKIITVITIERRCELTEKVVSAEALKHHIKHHGELIWPHCLPAQQIYHVVGKNGDSLDHQRYPRAKTLLDETYSKLSYGRDERGRAAGGALLLTPREQQNIRSLSLKLVYTKT